MKDHLVQTVALHDISARYNQAREYLQVYLLRTMHELGLLRHLAFVGGTALRLLFDLPRFSEDMDFSLDYQSKLSASELFNHFTKLKTSLIQSGYSVAITIKKPKNVFNILCKFIGLPHEIGITTDHRISITIKIEIDLKPPLGATIETSFIQKFFPKF